MHKTLGQKLRFLRQQGQYTQQQISNYLHIERTTYVNYENDKRTPSYHELLMIADFYNVHVEYLIRSDFSGNPWRQKNKAEKTFLNFCQLAPEAQKDVSEYIQYRLIRQRMHSH